MIMGHVCKPQGTDRRGLDSVLGLCLFTNVLVFRKRKDTDDSIKVPKALVSVPSHC